MGLPSSIRKNSSGDRRINADQGRPSPSTEQEDSLAQGLATVLPCLIASQALK